MKRIISIVLILVLLMGNLVFATDVVQSEPIKEEIQAKSTTTYSYNNPVVPRGFTYIEGTWNTGFVIQDESGNEFVWVPVDGTDVLYEEAPEMESLGGLEVATDEELASVEKYGGFYVGRYEAGLEGLYEQFQLYEDGLLSQTELFMFTQVANKKPISKRGVAAWCFNTPANMKTVAENMYEENEVAGFTKLMNNHAWEAIMTWLYVTEAKTEDEIYYDSTEWGNYLNSSFTYYLDGVATQKNAGDYIPMNTGAFSANNIYDLAGNFAEVTSKQCYYTANNVTTLNYVTRGGGFTSNGSSMPAWNAALAEDGGAVYNIGFRVVLYPIEEPPIPEGFTYVEGTEETGFTIQDADGNQFVWIPVDGTTVTLAQKDWGVGDLNITNVSDPAYTELTTSVTTYGGFYVAKYEASADGISLVDKEPQTNISYTDAYNKCNEYAPSTAIQSHLVYGAEWDATLQFMNTQKANYSTTASYGNYTGEIANTGATTTDIVAGICDMSGNVREWTQEVSNTNYRVFRGGYYNHDFAAGYRNSDIPETQDKYIGYRAAFYIK